VVEKRYTDLEHHIWQGFHCASAGAARHAMLKSELDILCTGRTRCERVPFFFLFFFFLFLGVQSFLEWSTGAGISAVDLIYITDFRRPAGVPTMI
jgi:hypothetical protein